MSDIELKVGRTYRAKKPANSYGLVNDRTLLFVGLEQVQYDGPAVANGRHYPRASREDFIKWADCDVTDTLPKAEYLEWGTYLIDKKTKKSWLPR